MSREGWTRLVNRVTERRRSRSIQSEVPVNPVCPTAVAFHAQVGTASSPRAHRLVAPGRQRRLSTTPQMAAAGSSGLPFVPPPALTGLFVGSGSDGLNEPAVAQAILGLVPKLPADVAVLYLGTATYDLPGPRERQTARFIEAGCRVRVSNLTNADNTTGTFRLRHSRANTTQDFCDLGFWNSSADILRAAYRSDSAPPLFQLHLVGGRLSRSAPP